MSICAVATNSFEDLAAFKFAFTGMETGKDLSLANGFAASGNYFDVLRIQPYLGHFFHASDEHGPNSAPYIVLTTRIGTAVSMTIEA